MPEQMDLETYKQKVKEFLRMNFNDTTGETERLMALYEDDFQEFFDDKWKPLTAATAMIDK